MPHEVVAALIVQNQKILLGQRSAERQHFPNVWDVFGGHIEQGEAYEQTLVRELREELGIIPNEWRFLETLTITYTGTIHEQEDKWITHLYLVMAWSGTPTNRQPDEHRVIGWFSLEEAKQLSLAHLSYPTLFARFLDPKDQ